MIYHSSKEEQLTTRKTLERVLKILTTDRMRLQYTLDTIVTGISGPPDGSVKEGDTFSFSNGVRVEVQKVETKKFEGHVEYTLRIYYGE